MNTEIIYKVYVYINWTATQPQNPAHKQISGGLSVWSLFPISYSIAVTFHYSSDLDRGTCMYIGMHCEQEDPYGFLSAHCVLASTIRQ